MKQKTAADYDRELAEIRQEKALWDKRAEIREVRRSMRRFQAPQTTTKRLMIFIFGNCSIVELYSMVTMWRFEDLSALYALITAVVTESVSFAVYACKAYHETKQEESNKLERERMEAESSSGASRAGAIPEDGSLL